MPLAETDQRHLTAAQGYVELGMWIDANTELEEIDPEVRHLPKVLEVRLKIYSALEKWDLMQVVASKLASYDPDHTQWTVSWAFAARRAVGVAAAREILLAAVERHPGAAILHFNLACYECRLGDVKVAKTRLHHAFKLDAKFRLLALDDEDLAPLWDALSDPST
jgi:hypothetical protein